MNRPWDADVDLLPEEAARRIERQFPALAPAGLAPLGVGWDNVAYLVNGRLVFRFPRRQIAADLIERETRVLPLLAPHLPLPIPAPAFAGTPDAGYPYPFAGYVLIPGTTACRSTWSDAQRASLAVPLARFLAALHTIPIDAETRTWGPTDDIERANLKKRARAIQERLRAIAPGLAGIDVHALLDLVDRLATTPAWEQPTCWVHGDLYARHLLVDDTFRPCGVIDWGDVHLGDPALDLSIAFSFLPPAARTTFRQAYGPVDGATWDRARFRALHYGVLLTDYGTEIGDDAIRGAGEYALRAAAVDQPSGG
jgi:aminoglycoside phosphotransferase (APT) family kinase protein